MSQRKSQSAIITDDPKLRQLHRGIADDIRREKRSVMCIDGEGDLNFAYTIGNDDQARKCFR